MATFYNIVHKTDKAFAPWHASTYEYACKLFMCIHDKRPDLSGQPSEPKTYPPVPDRPWNCSVRY